jgi:hypothetical protein
VRDPSTPELKQFNEKVFTREEEVSILGPSLRSLFEWNPNDVVFLEKLIKLVSLTHDMNALMDEIRLDHRGKRQAASSSDSGSSDEDNNNDIKRQRKLPPNPGQNASSSNSGSSLGSSSTIHQQQMSIRWVRQAVAMAARGARRPAEGGRDDPKNGEKR